MLAGVRCLSGIHPKETNRLRDSDIAWALAGPNQPSRIEEVIRTGWHATREALQVLHQVSF